MSSRARKATYKDATRPCKHGHMGPRYSNGNCVPCLLAREAHKYRSDPTFRTRKKSSEAQRYRSSAEIQAAYSLRGQRKRLIDKRQQPAWATEEKMLAAYLEAAKLTEATGIPHVVDHVVPLKGKPHGVLVVCGLHVETNLQVITAKQNSKKSFITWPGIPDYENS